MTITRRLIYLLRACGGLSLAFIASSSALALDAPCAQWNVGGTWTAIQSNHQRNSKGATLNLQQAGIQFKGSAQYQNENGVFIRGPVVGTAIRNAYTATIYWDDNRVGVYTGEIGPQGLVVGRTFDKNDAATSADWHADRSFDCLTAGRPPLALGRVPSNTPAPPVTLASLCEAAQSARARNSPSAPALERQCRERTAAATAPPATAPASLTQAKRSTAVQGPALIMQSMSATSTPTVLANPAAVGARATPGIASLLQNKADAVSLNPQPLPPAANLTPAQAPSSLR